MSNGRKCMCNSNERDEREKRRPKMRTPNGPKIMFASNKPNMQIFCYESSCVILNNENKERVREEREKIKLRISNHLAQSISIHTQSSKLLKCNKCMLNHELLQYITLLNTKSADNNEYGVRITHIHFFDSLTLEWKFHKSHICSGKLEHITTFVLHKSRLKMYGLI